LRSISGHEIFAVDVKKIEQKEDERGGVAGVGCVLDQTEGGDAVGTHAAQFAVEIGLMSAEHRDGRGDRRIFMGPVESGAREQPHAAAIEPRMHGVAVEFDFVEPLVAFRCGIDKASELRPDPLRQSDFLGALRAR
jgi:hypothetical protein